MENSTIETEIKLTAKDNTAQNGIAALTSIAGYTAADRGFRPHRDVYFDTDDLRLFYGKAVFRLRIRTDGSVLTFKAQGPPAYSGTTSLYRRIEIEQAADVTADDIAHGRLPDIPPVAAFRERFGAAGLKQCLEVKNNRRVIDLEKNGGAQFELVLDDVLFSGPRGERKVYEIEIEVKSGSEDELRSIGSWLTDRFALKPAGPSKYIHGMELVGGVDVKKKTDRSIH